MRTVLGVAAGLIAVAIGFWLQFATSQSATEISVSKASMTMPAISLWDIHNQAHLESLPVQEIDDQSLVFAVRARKTD
jgi:hypothetical protein